MARPRRNAVYRREKECRYCRLTTATYFAWSGPGLAWYLCGNPACRRMHEGQAPEPVEDRR